MARWAHAYPQVEPGAASLVDVAVVSVSATATVGEALRLVRRRDGRVCAAGRAWVLREDLARASALGLGELPAAAVARPLPVVDARAPEVTVRRELTGGAPLVIVRGPRTTLGAVAPRPDTGAAVSLGARLARWLPPASQAVLATIGRLALGRRGRAFAVGGLVRDALRQGAAAPRDLDVVVEGDGLALARDLAREVGGALVEHARFLTASVALPGAGRVDVATSRLERYDTPGALPRVMPAGIGPDLGRRDFTINAMAIDLTSGAFELLDPHGGRRDLADRRLTVLHPLSFVEDPTRVFRAARYAARLGFALDGWTARWQALALRRGPYPALSGARLVAELRLLLADARPEVALIRLGRAGAFRLLDPRYRFTRATAARVPDVPRLLAWLAASALEADPGEVVVLFLLDDQPDDVARAAVRRLGFAGDRLAGLEAARATVPTLADRLAEERTASGRAARLRGRRPLELAWLWARGGARARDTVTWYVDRGRAVHAKLRGEDVIGLGVPRGPHVARVLAELRDGRLDGRLTDRAAEVAYVRERLGAATGSGDTAREAGGGERAAPDKEA
jgi:tRNA nucleotidyltransferase (CCA-adding enzyme)